MKMPWIVSQHGKLIDYLELRNKLIARAAKRAAALAKAKHALMHGKEGVDYYV